MSAAVSIFVQFVYACSCITCGTPIVIPADRLSVLKEKHTTFYCSNGHSQYFPGKSDLEKAREDLVQQQRVSQNLRVAVDNAVKEKTKAERKLKNVQHRVGNGVCPCCHRSFVALQRHMATKHPEYKEGKVA